MQSTRQRLSPEQLRKEEAATLTSPPAPYGLLARILFGVMGLLYGRGRSWSKFKVLELIARVPYQAWEHVAYIAITHTYEHEDFARRIFDRFDAMADVIRQIGIDERRHKEDSMGRMAMARFE